MDTLTDTFGLAQQWLFETVLQPLMFHIGLANLLSDGYLAERARLHAILVALMAAFISLVILVIASNDNPYRGSLSIGPDSYKLILENVISKVK